jgi:hypothetical protein
VTIKEDAAGRIISCDFTERYYKELCGKVRAHDMIVRHLEQYREMYPEYDNLIEMMKSAFEMGKDRRSWKSNEPIKRGVK